MKEGLEEGGVERERGCRAGVDVIFPTLGCRRKFGISTLKGRRMKSSFFCYWMHNDILYVHSGKRLKMSSSCNCSVFSVGIKLCPWTKGEEKAILVHRIENFN